MFCPDCGTWNRASAARCTRCDEALPELAGTPSEKPDAELTQLRANTGGRYRVIRRLGSGGMAHVYYAEHALLDRPVVIKVTNMSAAEHGFLLTAEESQSAPTVLKAQLVLKPGETKYVGVPTSDLFYATAGNILKYRCHLHPAHVGGKLIMIK